jgi:hypothetical protein
MPIHQFLGNSFNNGTPLAEVPAHNRLKQKKKRLTISAKVDSYSIWIIRQWFMKKGIEQELYQALTEKGDSAVYRCYH